MFDVVSIAAARVAARELALAVVPALQGTAQGTRDGARPAPDVKNLAIGAIGAVVQHHEPDIAGYAAGRLPAEVEPAHLFDDGQAGVQVRARRRPFARCSIGLQRFRGNVSRGDSRRPRS